MKTGIYMVGRTKDKGKSFEYFETAFPSESEAQAWINEQPQENYEYIAVDMADVAQKVHQGTDTKQ